MVFTHLLAIVEFASAKYSRSYRVQRADWNIWCSRHEACVTRRTTRARWPGWRRQRFEFRPHDRNVEAPAASTVQPAYPATAADVGSAAHSGCPLPIWLARPHPTLSFSPQSCCFVSDSSIWPSWSALPVISFAHWSKLTWHTWSPAG